MHVARAWQLLEAADERDAAEIVKRYGEEAFGVRAFADAMTEAVATAE